MTDVPNKPITTDQHYVPKFYLKRFVNERKCLKVLDIKNAKLQTTWRAYATLGYEKFYYAVHTGVPDVVSQQIEDFFTQLENGIASRLDGIHKKILQYQPITNEERYVIATLGAMLYLRGKYMREQLKRGNESIFRQMMIRYADHPAFPQSIQATAEANEILTTAQEIEECRLMLLEADYDVAFDNTSHLFLLGEVQGFANMLYNKPWIAHLAQEQDKFFTSDTPMLEILPEKKHFHGPHFMERTHYLPLSPKMVIEFIPSMHGKPLKRKVADTRKVFDLNTLRLAHSIDEAYSGWLEEFEVQLVGKSDPALFRLQHALSNLARFK